MIDEEGGNTPRLSLCICNHTFFNVMNLLTDHCTHSLFGTLYISCINCLLERISELLRSEMHRIKVKSARDCKESMILNWDFAHSVGA